MARDLSIPEETAIVSLLARGDTYAEIQAELVSRLGRQVSRPTIQKVKQRNKENLKVIEQTTLAKYEADSAAIKKQANATIKKKLDNEELSVKLVTKAHEQYMDDEITIDDYMKLVKSVKTASFTELVSISREMHSQSAETPPVTSDPEAMRQMIEALESGDEVKLSQAVFKRGQPNTPPPAHI